MLTYIGSGACCHADSSAMLLKSAGDSIDPCVIEVPPGVLGS